MDDPNLYRFIWGLEFQFKHKFSFDKVKWWLEERFRCMTYGCHFLSLKKDEKMVKKVLSPKEFYADTKDDFWVDEKNLGSLVFLQPR